MDANICIFCASNHFLGDASLNYCMYKDSFGFGEKNKKSVDVVGVLGHLSNSGDLLLWGWRLSSSVNIFFSRTTGPILTQFGM